jgi:putative flippase GtrA
VPRAVRFAIVGLANTLAYWWSFLLLQIAVSYAVAHVGAWLLAMIFSFFANCAFTFRVRPTLPRFLLFPLSTLPSFASATVGLVVLVEVFEVDSRVAPLLSAILAVPVTYFVLAMLLRSNEVKPDANRRFDWARPHGG